MEKIFLPLTRDKKFCFSNERKIYISKYFCPYRYIQEMNDDIIVEENLDDAFMKKADEKIRKLDNALCIKLGKKLNEIHETNLSMEFWKKVLNSSWLYPLLCSVYYRYFRLKYVFDNYKECCVRIALLTPQSMIIAHDVTEYVFRTETEAYDFQIWSRIAKVLSLQCSGIKIDYVEYGGDTAQDEIRLGKGLKLSDRTVRTTFFQRQIKRLQRAVNLFRESDFQALEMFAKRFLVEELSERKKVKCYLYYPGLDALVFDRVIAQSNGKILPLPRRSVNESIRHQIEIDYRKREDIITSISNEFSSDLDESNLAKILLQELPMCFLEAFPTIRRRYQPYLQSNIKYIVSQHGTYLNTAFMLFAAEMHDLYGTELRGIQHGGNYQIHNIPIGDAFLSDKMYCWGKCNADGYFISSASNKLKEYEIQEKCIAKDIGILYVGDYCPRYLWRRVKPKFSENLIAERMSFFRNLREDIHDKILVRLLKQYEYWDADLLLKNSFQWIKIDNMQYDFNYMIKRSKCCVTELMLTTWLEALVANTPVLMTDLVAEYSVRTSERFYFDMLREVGILHEDLTSVARLLNKIYYSIDSWWNESKRQEVVKIITERYWNDFGNPDVWWEKELISLVDEK